MDVKDLDLPIGIGSACNRKKSTLLDATKINKIKEVNKDCYINTWLETNEVCDVSNQSFAKTETDVSTTKSSPKSRSSDIVSEHNSRPTITSSLQSRLSKRLEENQQINLVPAGYNISESSKKSKSSTSSKTGTSKRTHTLHAPRLDQFVLNMDEHNPNGQNSKMSTKSKEQSKTANQENLKPSIENTMAGNSLDPSWEAIFNQKVPSWHNATKEQTEKIQSHMKKAVGLCTCAKCEQEVPTELVHDNIDAVGEAPKGPSEHKRPAPLLKLDNVLLSSVMSTPVIKNAPNTNTLPLLTHGHTVPHPQYEISRTNLIPQVQQRLAAVGYERCKPIQSYGWSGILRGNNVVMINGPETGKSLTYVAPLCSFLMDDAETYDRITDKSRGPVLTVVANSSSIAEQVYAMFSAIMRKDNNRFAERVWLAILPLSQNQINCRFKKADRKTEVIITTPDTLIFLLNERVIDLKRLRHIVFENVDIIMDKMPNNFDLIINAITSMLNNRNSYIGVQYISTGERWTKRLEQFVVKLYNFPLIIIGNPMQAALYGRADIKLQYLEQKNKPEQLVELLKTSNYQLYKCIVVCKLDEVKAIEDQFSTNGISFVTTTDVMNGEEVMDLQITWKTTPSGKCIVLICTDKALRSYIKLANASFLINYSLPPTWTLFSQRFGTLMDSYLCPLTSTFDENKYNCKLVTFVDEKCVDRFPRLSSFYKANRIEIPELLKQYCKEQQRILELEKVNQNTKLCKCLLLFGECYINNCPDRHIFSKSIEGFPKLPENGQITGRFINMKQPNYFNLQLLQYKDLEGKIHYLENFGEKVERIISQYTGFSQCIDVIKGERYIYVNKGKIHRCIVTRIAKYVSIGTTTTTEPLEVDIYGLDNGLKSLTNVDKLFVMPDELKEIPQSVVEVIVAHLIPPFKQSMWTNSSHQDLLSEIKDFNEDSFAMGNILLRLNNTIWVDDIQLKTIEGPFTKWFVLSKHLKQRKLYERSESSLAMLYKLCEEAEIALPEYRMPEAEPIKASFEQEEGSWAHLTKDELNLVFFSTATSSNSLYVKLTKYDDLLKQLEEDIGLSNKSLMRKLAENEISVGCCYAIVDQASGGCCRVLLTGIDEDMVATCFYVDYGDLTTVPIACLKFLSDVFITRLPFQAIQCSLYGLEENNSGQLIDVLYDYTQTALCAKYISDEQVVSSFGTIIKYKIVLIDYTKEPRSINKELIEAGFAEKCIDEKLEDVEIPVFKELPENTNEEENWDEEDKRCNDVQQAHENFEVIHENMGEVERQTASTSINKNEYLPMKAAPASDKIPPQIIWYQTEKEIFIQFMFLENNDYKINLTRNRFLNFSSNYNGKSYNIAINLFESVKKTINHESKTQFILLTLTKEKELIWTRLSKSEQRLVNIKYKYEKIEEDSSDSEDLRAEDDPRFFQHIAVSKDGVVHEFYSDPEDSESDYNDNDDWE